MQEITQLISLYFLLLQCRELPLCAGSGEGCQWQALPSPVQCEETATRTRDLPVTGGKTLPLAPGPPFKLSESELYHICWLDLTTKKVFSKIETNTAASSQLNRASASVRSGLPQCNFVRDIWLDHDNFHLIIYLQDVTYWQNIASTNIRYVK